MIREPGPAPAYYAPIDIVMNQKFSSQGLRAFVFQELSQYTGQIYASDYENYVNEKTTVYPHISNISETSLLYQLKQNGVKVLICVCIYNEPSQAISLTMNGVYHNLRHLKEKLDIDENEVAVVLVQDGILKCDQSVVNMYAQMEAGEKCYLKERIAIIKEEVENAARQGKKAGVDNNDNFPETIPKRISLLYQNKYKPKNNPGRQSLNLLTCFKHLNGKKLSSHAWFFEGFCRYLKPQFCILLDVGTEPDPKGVYHLIKGMIQDENIGGVSGFMGIDSNFQSLEGDNNGGKEDDEGDAHGNLHTVEREAMPPEFKYTQENKKVGPHIDGQGQQLKHFKTCEQQFSQCFDNLFCSVEKAQEVQYIYAHFLDKNFESFTGFLHVLPGAWSGYRLKALQTEQTFNPDILQKKYFKTIINPQLEEGEDAYKQANMYLAEDRILSLAIYCQPNRKYYLKYIPNARAKTDPMKSHYNLITQRRRWINSSLFAFEYVFANYSFDMRDSHHSPWDYIMMNLNMFIAAINFLNAYLIPCFYLFILYCIVRNNETLALIPGEYFQTYLALILCALYVGTVVAAVGGSLNGMRWIKETKEEVVRNSNGAIRTDKDGKPIKRKYDVNGPAIHISRIIGFFTYLLMLLICEIIVRTILKFFRLYNDLPNKARWKPNQQYEWQQSITLLVLLVLNLSSQFFTLVMHLPSHPREVWSYFKGWISYVSYQGVYTHTMTIFGFCNVDDASWGTKGATDTSGQKKFASKKMFFVSTWLFWNSIICFIFFFTEFILTKDTSEHNFSLQILLVISIYSTVMLVIKTFFAFLNHVRFYLCRCCEKDDRVEKILQQRRNGVPPNERRNGAPLERVGSEDGTPLKNTPINDPRIESPDPNVSSNQLMTGSKSKRGNQEIEMVEKKREKSKEKPTRKKEEVRKTEERVR